MKKGRVLERQGEFFDAVQTVRASIDITSEHRGRRVVCPVGRRNRRCRAACRNPGTPLKGPYDDFERAEFLMEPVMVRRFERVNEASQCYEAVIKMAGDVSSQLDTCGRPPSRPVTSLRPRACSKGS